MKLLRYLLAPFALLYWLGVWLRNAAYDLGLRRSQAVAIKSICVGNLTVGGTGKTPHTEYLLRLLQGEFQVGMLSRGYRRRTKGYVEASTDSTALQVGDEPLQIKRKFPNATVAVEADRLAGVAAMQRAHPQLQVVLLDDAFQHRRLKPGLSLLLIDYSRPIYADHMLPMGWLRDTFAQRRRADVVVVTKCPASLTEQQMADAKQRLRLLSHQQLYFTRMAYGALRPILSPQQPMAMPPQVAVLCGIARPQPFIDYLQQHTQLVAEFVFPDHHNFAKREIIAIFEQISRHGDHIPLITTEKDAARLIGLNLPEHIAQRIAYQEVAVEFVGNQSESFNKTILRYVREN